VTAFSCLDTDRYMRTTNIIAKRKFILAPPPRQRRRRTGRPRPHRRPRPRGPNRSRSQSPRPGPNQSESRPRSPPSLEGKYDDSGDSTLSKAGEASADGALTTGSQHSLPEHIPCLTAPDPNDSVNDYDHVMGMQLLSGRNDSPVKESSFLYCQNSVDEQDYSLNQETPTSKVTSPPTNPEMSIRWQHFRCF
jgi:hypothetical protein